ncbi:MAG: lipoyl(octanoyl) transferase LipB [Bacteroidetes bacterium]|nr:lipoyl(octanoyl) transferase LipB [Bacteroidota bacterium]
MTKNNNVYFQDLKLIEYVDAWKYQEDLFNSIICQKLINRDKERVSEHSPTDNYMLFCEHPHVYTLGKNGQENNLLAGIAELAAKKASFVKIDRGGDITYHGPGQIVGYPILDLDNFNPNIRQYVEFLEEAAIRTIAEYGLHGDRLNGASGVWLDINLPGKTRKICAIGIRTSRWVTMHGFAFNVNTDLNYYNYINPCGFTDKKATSLEVELGKKLDIEEVKSKLKNHLVDIFGMNLVCR